ncbi:MAG: aspartate 1-decarboxylase [Spartobacteria bacterium]|nr:aspartate 1-decarboxylase [Spartobacteria bacterium]
MQRNMLKSKIHRATLTGLELDYEGSIGIDLDLLEAADILPGEQVHVLNVNNGTRLMTYAIPAPRGSREFMLNGPAARLGIVGDKVIVLTYCTVSDEEAKTHRSQVIHVDDKNNPV